MKKRKYTKDIIEPVVKQSTSIAQVLNAFELKATGGNYRSINTRIREYNIDTSHFSGQGWAKNKTKKNSISLLNASLKLRHPDDQVFSNNSGYTSSKLYNRLVERGIEEKCSNTECTVTNKWINNKIRLHVDHIDGNHNNNELSNLRLLCPNCHSQTSTWGFKKR